MSESKFLHIGTITLRDDVTDEQRKAFVEGLRGFDGAIPSLRSIQVFEDLGLSEGNGDIVFIATFDDEQGWREYSVDETHVSLVKKLIPAIAHKVFVQAKA
mgnify:CR=1 FL=1